MSGSGRLSLFSANRRRYFRVVLPAKLGLIGLILLFSLSAGKNDEDMVPMSNQASKVEQSSDTTYKLHPKIITIDSLVRIDNLSAAISTYKQLISNKTDLPIGGHIYVGNVIGNNLNRLRQFDSTLTWLDTSYSLEKARPIDTLLLALQYYIRGVAYNFLNKPDSSEKYHHKALYLRTNHSTQITEDLVSSYMGLGNIKRYLIHDYDSASIYYELATQTLTNQTGEPNKGLLFRCQYNLAATYYRRGNRDKAIFFCKEALRNAEEIGRPIFITFSLDLLRNIYVNYEDFENTEIYARKLIKMYDAGQMENYRILAWSHINVAISQTEKLEYDSALISLNKAHEITKNELSGDSRTLSSIYEEIGVTHNDAKNYDEALAHYHKSLSLKSDEVPGNFTTIYKLLGQFHLDRQQNDSALYYLQKSLHSLTSEFPESDYARVPLADSIPQNNQIVDLIRYKALTLSRIAESEDQYDNLLLAKANYLLGDSIISINRSHDLLESEELWMANDIQDYYAEALRCIYKLSLIKEHQPDYNVALRFIDQNKAQIMLRSLKESLFLESNGAHDSLVQYNKDVNAELAHWKNSKEIQTDEESRIEIEKKIFQLISKKKEIDKLINSTYDDFQNTFHAKSLTIDQLANITESDSTLI
ncbi:MAG: tetratricopeptide repeat protein, partial [Bacteroidota bacterium]